MSRTPDAKISTVASASAVDTVTDAMASATLTETQINDMLLEEDCKRIGIDKSWIGDGQLHSISTTEPDGTTGTAHFTIEMKHTDHGFVFHGLYPDPESCDASIPQEFWSFIRWECSRANGMVRHKYNCGEICDCVGTPISTNVEDLYAEHLQEQTQEFIVDTPFDQVIEHPDFHRGSDFLGFDLAWVRDDKPHTWTRQAQAQDGDENQDRGMSSGKDEKKEPQQFIHDGWTINANIEKEGGLFFFGTFVAKDTDVQMCPDIILDAEYAWEWDALNGLRFFAESDLGPEIDPELVPELATGSVTGSGTENFTESVVDNDE